LTFAIVKAVAAQRRLDFGVPLDALESQPQTHVDEDPTELDSRILALRDPKEDRIYDEYTGLELDRERVHEARLQEITFIHQLRVYRVRPISECLEQTGRQPLPTRWIDHDKNGGFEVGGVGELLRSRLVVCETKFRSTIEKADIVAVYSATPPLEIFRALCSLCMSLPPIDGECFVLMFLDISRAHPHCKVLRPNLYIKLPPECGAGPDNCGLLDYCLYGLRDANQAFEFKVKETAEDQGFTQGKHTACAYSHPSKPVAFAVHGDDYVVLGLRRHLLEFFDKLNKALIVKNRGILGPAKDDLKNISMLSRTISWIDGVRGEPDKLVWEADSRHVDVLCTQLGIQASSNTRATPADKVKWSKSPPLSGAELPAPDVALFKSCCMRLGFIALDRPEVQFVSKEIARTMSAPTIAALDHLKHMARFLRRFPRARWIFRRQNFPSTVDGYGDSNWAGCTITRKSTTCIVLMLGKHCLATASFTQSVISLSSGEAEFYALVKLACRIIGMANLLIDLGHQFRKVLNSDASAGLGIASRRGAAGVRHIDTQTLWIQQRVARRELQLKKLSGHVNPADLGTKVLDGQTIARLLQLLSIETK